MDMPADLRYSTDHEWVRVDGSVATIGVTDFAQDALGDVVFVQLPTAGGVVAAGASFAEVESTKSVSDVYAPVSGTVIDVNASLADQPEQINLDPYGAGWICRIELADPTELDALLDAAGYGALIGQ
jgi:glycine cleavage system H protein